MRKTFTINISGIVFHIDEDAYEMLQGYLSKINKRFSNTEEGREIISDIEGRIAEIFRERLEEQGEVITLEHVEEVIKIMGKPEEIIDDEEFVNGSSDEQKNWKTKTGKRIYRDPDDRILGGVCSGISAYFGLDPLILRILFVIMFFIPAGSGFLIYIILWIILPEAKTTAQKLEMKGEKVNIDNIEKSIKTEFEGVKKNWRKIRKERKHRGLGYAIERIIYFIGEIIHAVFRAIGPIIGVSLVLIGLIVLLGIFGDFVFSKGFFSFSHYGISFFSVPEVFDLVTNSGLAFLTYLGIILVIGIPIIGMIYGGIRLIFRIRGRNRIVSTIAGSLWSLGIISLVLSGVGIGKEYRLITETRSETALDTFGSDTLFVNVSEDTFTSGTFLIMLDEVKLRTEEGKNMLFLRPEMDVEMTDGENINMEIVKSGRGSDIKDAKYNINSIDYHWEQNDSAVVLSPYYTLKKNRKWRGQKLYLTIKIPEGKYIYFSPELRHIIYDIDNFSGTYDIDMLGKFWVMTSEGLKKAVSNVSE